MGGSAALERSGFRLRAGLAISAAVVLALWLMKVGDTKGEFVGLPEEVGASRCEAQFRDLPLPDWSPDGPGAIESASASDGICLHEQALDVVDVTAAARTPIALDVNGQVLPLERVAPSLLAECSQVATALRGAVVCPLVLPEGFTWLGCRNSRGVFDLQACLWNGRFLIEWTGSEGLPSSYAGLGGRAVMHVALVSGPRRGCGGGDPVPASDGAAIETWCADGSGLHGGHLLVSEVLAGVGVDLSVHGPDPSTPEVTAALARHLVVVGARIS